jgi:hypothetical protein
MYKNAINTVHPRYSEAYGLKVNFIIMYFNVF